MRNIEIDGLSTNLYSYSYSKIYLNENEAKFMINFNFATSFNNTPTFKIHFDLYFSNKMNIFILLSNKLL